MKKLTLNKGEENRIAREGRNLFTLNMKNGSASISFVRADGLAETQPLFPNTQATFSNLHLYAAFIIKCHSDVCTIEYELLA